MNDELFKFISATFGISVAVAVAIIALAFWLTHYVTKKVTTIHCEHESIKEQHKEHSKKVNDIDSGLRDCKSTLKTTEKITDDLGEIRRDLSYLKGTIDIIKSGAPSLMASHSPVSLTNEGKMVVAELCGDAIIDANWEKILYTLKLAGEKTPYDIQQLCMESVSVEPERYFSTVDLDKIKQYAFSKGQPLQLYLRVLGLVIRDRYFAEQNIPLSKIDETAPISPND